MAETFFRVADENEDGELTRDEFFNWGKHHHRAFRQTRGEGEGEGEAEAKIVNLKKSTEIVKEILGDGKPNGDKWVESGMKGHMCDKTFWAAAAKEYQNRYPKDKPESNKE